MNPSSKPLFRQRRKQLNAMLAAETMTGADRIRVPALPKDRFLCADSASI
ncbi:MAG: hypothetical protein IPI09_20280 [Burkholderiales bacterium]|nr:hypothetical protein [Burkholderiales bacterium]